MKSFYYTMTGPQAAPEDIKLLMTKCAKRLSALGAILRSGGSIGCENHAELGCDLANGQKRIYLPWENFNENKSTLHCVSEQAITIAKKHQKNNSLFDKKNPTLLLGRDSYMLLGDDLNDPSSFLVTYIPENPKQEQLHILKLADDYSIKIFDLAKYGSNHAGYQMVLNELKSHLITNDFLNAYT